MNGRHSDGMHWLLVRVQQRFVTVQQYAIHLAAFMAVGMVIMGGGVACIRLGCRAAV